MYEHLNTDKRKWVTITEYVDLETGEVIPKATMEREYYKVRSTPKYEENENYRIRKYTTECRRNGQQKLEL